MSIFNSMICNCNEVGQEERDMEEKYIDGGLPNINKNATYTFNDKWDVCVKTPQECLGGKNGYVCLGTDNLPTYIIKFKSLEKAQRFMGNNFSLGTGQQKNIKVDVVGTVLGSAIVIQPINLDYEVHIEVASEEVARKLVKMFRRQYIDNRQLAEIKARGLKTNQHRQSEVERLGIEF